MRDYLLKLGINAKRNSLESISSKKKNKVLKDYISLISRNH